LLLLSKGADIQSYAKQLEGLTSRRFVPGQSLNETASDLFGSHAAASEAIASGVGTSSPNLLLQQAFQFASDQAPTTEQLVAFKESLLSVHPSTPLSGKVNMHIPVCLLMTFYMYMCESERFINLPVLQYARPRGCQHSSLMAVQTSVRGICSGFLGQDPTFHFALLKYVKLAKANRHVNHAPAFNVERAFPAFWCCCFRNKEWITPLTTTGKPGGKGSTSNARKGPPSHAGAQQVPEEEDNPEAPERQLFDNDTYLLRLQIYLYVLLQFLLLGRKADLGPDGFQVKICHVTYSSTFCTEAGLPKLPEYVDLFIQHHSKMTPAHKRFFEHGAVYRLWANPRNLRVCPVFHIAAFIASAGLQLEDYLFCGLHTGASHELDGSLPLNPDHWGHALQALFGEPATDLPNQRSHPGSAPAHVSPVCASPQLHPPS
jgi:hypothetical protein